MDSVAKYMKDENDILFIVGKKQAEEKFIARLLEKFDLTIEQIADAVGVSVDFVLRTKKKISDRNLEKSTL